MENWLPEQITSTTENWSEAISKYYPSDEYWSSGEKNVALMQECYFKPLITLDWSRYLDRPNMRALDLGAGGGWLSAWLSKKTEIVNIDVLDSNRRNLEVLLPETIRLMEGDPKKISKVLGLFEPIQRTDDYYDLIVASGSVHHSSNLFRLMRELFRVLKPTGTLIVMNEIPRTFEQYLNYVMTINYLVLKRALNQETSERQESISANGILYDPILGDFALSYFHYHHAIVNAGFDYKPVHTGYFAQGFELTHFVCSRREEAAAPSLYSRVDRERAENVEPITQARFNQLMGISGEGVNFDEQISSLREQIRQAREPQSVKEEIRKISLSVYRNIKRRSKLLQAMARSLRELRS